MSKKQKRLFWSSLAVIILALPAIALVSRRTRNGEPSTIKPVSAQALERPGRAEVVRSPGSLLPGDSDEQVEVEVITVRSGGFEPGEIVRPPGRFMLAINNHSGVGELSLHLDRLDGNRFAEVRMPKGRIRWNPLVNLPPGDYLLKEQNHPAWVCRIKLTPK